MDRLEFLVNLKATLECYEQYRSGKITVYQIPSYLGEYWDDAMLNFIIEFFQSVAEDETKKSGN